MEADEEPEQLQTDDTKPFLSFCPNFNSYSSSDQCAQIAADVADERPRASDDFEYAFEKAEDISHDACENQDEETRGKDAKGKEIAAGNRSRIARPPLSFLAILDEYGIPPLDTSCPEQLCRQLYDGVFLKPDKLKYFVDEKSNKNCFVLFARELIITHFEKTQYWQWEKDKETSGEDIEVARLLEVWWLEVKGAIRTINLSPGTLYEIVFILKKLDKDSNFNLTFTIKPQHLKALTRSESLKEKPLQNWFEVLAGEFMFSTQYVGNMEFRLENTGGDWKRGIVVKCAIVRPKK